jgi:hypothetical protein
VQLQEWTADMEFDRDMVAQWAGEELSAAAIADGGQGAIHRLKGALLLDALRRLRNPGARCPDFGGGGSRLPHGNQLERIGNDCLVFY